jgi:hypothetical protein
MEFSEGVKDGELLEKSPDFQDIISIFASFARFPR